MHAILSFHGNRPTNTHTITHTHIHRQDRLQYTALQLARSAMNWPAHFSMTHFLFVHQSYETSHRTASVTYHVAHRRQPCASTASALCRLIASAVIDRIQTVTSDQLVKLIMSVILNALTLSRPALSVIVTNCCN